MCFRKNSRKLPHRTASAAKKKLLSVYKEDDTTINSDSEKELEDINSKALFFSGSSDPGKQKHNSDYGNVEGGSGTTSKPAVVFCSEL